jgi:N-acetylated-alpha-linked acidic dipeptidase
MRQLRFITVPLLCAVTGASREAPAQETPLTGFSPAAAQAERALEASFDAEIRRIDIHDWMQRLASRPHHVGSPNGQANAEWMAGLFRSWGYETRIETYQVLFPTPKSRLVEMLAPRPFRASLVEPALPEDMTSDQSGEQLPSYNAYSIDGDVTGELVYVNYAACPRTTRSSSGAASKSRAGS